MYLELMLAAGQLAIGAFFLRAGLRKLADADGTKIAILDYQIVPISLAKIVATPLSIAESAVGAALLLNITAALPIALLLLGVISVAAALALGRGLEIDCHCFAEGEQLSWLTLVRNAVFGLILASTLWLVPAGHRSSLEPRLLSMPHPYQLTVGLASVFVVMAIGLLMTLRRPATRKGALK